MFDTTFTRLPSWKINTIYTSQSFNIPIESKVEKILAISEAPYPSSVQITWTVSLLQ